MNFSADNQIKAFRNFISRLKFWIGTFRKPIFFEILLFFFWFGADELILWFENQLSLKGFFCVDKNIFKKWIIMPKNGVNHLQLQSWLENLQLRSLYYHHGIQSELFIQRLSDTLENIWWEKLVFVNTAYSNEPVVNILILLSFWVSLTHINHNLLQSTSKIAEEAHTNQFDEYLEKIFIACWSFNISIPNTWKSSEYPIYWWII